MLISPIDFDKKIKQEYNIDRNVMLTIFNNATEDKDFLKQMEKGYKPYLILNVDDKTNFSMVNIRNDPSGLEYINQKDIIAVEGFKYLKDILSS